MLKLTLLAVLGATLAGWAARAGGGSLRDGRFEMVRTASVDAEELLAELAVCQAGTPAFADVVAGISPDRPLPTHASDSVPGPFGGSYDSRTGMPLFQVNIRELRLLPSAADVRAWSPESSWAWTRCEILVHELAEAIAHRELVDRSAADGDTLPFARRQQRAHSEGIRAEHAVAAAQHTRSNARGEPYGRTRECFGSGYVHVVFGMHTATVTRGAAGVTRIAYNPNADLCAAL